MVCLMFQMRGCVAGDVFCLHGDAVWVEKRDSDRAVDRGIMRKAREGSELGAGQTPYM